MTLLATRENPKWRPAAVFENVEWQYFCNGSCNHFAFGCTAGFSGRRIECLYFRLDQIQDRRRQPSCIILNGHISETVRPIQFVFGSRVKV